MKYTVVWTPAAEQELAGLWIDAADRNAVSAAAREIDRRLKSAPAEQGESRSGDMRVFFVGPLGVFYHVNRDDRIARVVRVWSVP